jgi:serine/threonine protein kinase
VGRVNEQVVSLEKEVAVLKQLDHPNIVRYLVSCVTLWPTLVNKVSVDHQQDRTESFIAQGTERTDECLNIFLEFVPGGSIASLINKFGGETITVSFVICAVCTISLCIGPLHLHRHEIGEVYDPAHIIAELVNNEWGFLQGLLKKVC